MKTREIFWLLMAAAGIVVMIGCSQTEVEDATSAIQDTAAAHGPQIVENLSEGDWAGAAVATVIAVVTGVSGYYAYRRKRRKKAK